jgi:hypothetical protein
MVEQKHRYGLYFCFWTYKQIFIIKMYGHHIHLFKKTPPAPVYVKPKHGIIKKCVIPGIFLFIFNSEILTNFESHEIGRTYKRPYIKFRLDKYLFLSSWSKKEIISLLCVVPKWQSKKCVHYLIWYMNNIVHFSLYTTDL